MRFLKPDQVYYSLEKDADFCARAVADLIRSDGLAWWEAGLQERIRRQAEIFGAKIGEAFDKFVRNAVNEILR